MVDFSADCAVMYVRMSTENQDYSTDHQRAMIQEYAARWGISIIREYVDDGKSGLDIKHRPGLRALMRDVQSAKPDFSRIIVYDISRWGRFQDIDEAAYHEHTCRRAGIEVVYCGEKFAGDTGPYASLLKSMKRVMAAEYSRELSEKVFVAQSRFVEMGYKQGGHAGYGLRRLALKANGAPREILRFGEAKAAVTDRVILIWGPMEEVATVRRIYSLYLDERLSVGAIARLLNSENVPSEFDRPWTQHMIRTLLSNVKYCGILAFNRRSSKLSTPRKRNARDQWIVNTTALAPIIDSAMFDQVQAERARRTYRYTHSELIGLLKNCYLKHGKINTNVITADSAMPDVDMFARAFGSLVLAYDAAALPRTSSFAFLETKKKVSERRRELFDCVVRQAQIAGAIVEKALTSFTFSLNSNLLVRVDVLAPYDPKRGRQYWRLYPKSGIDFIIAGRIDPALSNMIDFLLVPVRDLPEKIIYLTLQKLDRYSAMKHDSVGSIFGTIADDRPPLLC